MLALLSNYLLPILFGIAGTFTSLMRDIQVKIKDSMLAPRDSALALIRLPLGIIAGISVGLFFNGNATSASFGSVLGTFALSSSALAFLAGYGAEVFFRALDILIARLFNLDK